MSGQPFEVVEADSAAVWSFDDEVTLVWTDPPFGTGARQTQGGNAYTDVSPAEAVTFTVAAVRNLHPHLAADGVVCVVADYRIVHHLVVALAEFLFFQGEVVWSFGLGRPRTAWWPNRHNTIVTFTRTPHLPPFDVSAVPRERRKAPKPGYGGSKPAGSVWDRTLSNTDPERVGYPNQKPVDIVAPFVLAHTRPGDVVADPFAGSGTTGVAALRHGRRFVGQDTNPAAVALMERRLDGERGLWPANV